MTNVVVHLHVSMPTQTCTVMLHECTGIITEKKYCLHYIKLAAFIIET